MSGGGGTTTQVQKSDPWGPAQPYLLDLMNKSQETYNQQDGQTSSPSQYVGYSPETQDALSATWNRALSGSPLIDTAQSAMADIASGSGMTPAQQYLTPFASGAMNGQNNQYLNDTFKTAADQVRDYTNATFSKAGRTGSTYNQDVLEKNIGNLASTIYGNAYDSDMNRHMAAASGLQDAYSTGQQQRLSASALSPTLANQDYQDLQNMLTVGQAYDANNQAKASDIYSQWQYAQQQPWQNLLNYASGISGLGNLGGTSTATTTQPSQSLIPSLLGSGIGLLAAPATGGGSLFASLLGF